VKFCFVAEGYKKFCSVTTCNFSTCKLHLPEIIGLKILFLSMNAVGLSSYLRYILIKIKIFFHFEFIKLMIFGAL